MVKDLHSRIICIKADSGLPLFVRSVGSYEQLPDPVVASLNGIYTFCSSYGVKLVKTVADDVCTSWKTFYKSLTLILVTNASLDEEFCEGVLNLIFNSFVLLLGSERLQQNVSFDKLKSDLQVCYRLVDSLIAMDEHHISTCVMTRTVSSLSSPDLSNLQLQFEGFASHVGSSQGCFFIGGLLSAATTKMMQLTPLELVLLQCFVSSILVSSSSNVVETAIYLPDTSPNKATKLILLDVIHDGTICLLLDDTTPVGLSNIISKTHDYWGRKSDGQSNINLSLGNLNLVYDLSKMLNKSLPFMKDINKDIVSFLLVNQSLHESLMCTDVNKPETNSKVEKGQILKTFYLASQRFFNKTSSIKNTGQGIEVPCTTEMNHTALSSYIWFENFKCYAFRDKDREIYIVFNSSMPFFAMRPSSKEFLNHLLGLKWFHL